MPSVRLVLYGHKYQCVAECTEPAEKPPPSSSPSQLLTTPVDKHIDEFRHAQVHIHGHLCHNLNVDFTSSTVATTKTT